ncbi:MAG: hypothetical protein ACK4N5_13305, partial [Myxococcales bacterium]
MNLLRTYAWCLKQTGKAIGRSPWTLLLPMAYLLLLQLLVGAVIVNLGLAGGIVYAMLRAALLASVLFVVAELVAGSSVKPQDLPNSFKAFFWPVVNVFFVLFIANLLLGPLIANHPRGHAIDLALTIILFILLNAVPESIYLRGQFGGIASITSSVQFIQEHWIEWFIPSGLLGAAWYYGGPFLARLPFGAVLQPVAL